MNRGITIVVVGILTFCGVCAAAIAHSTPRIEAKLSSAATEALQKRNLTFATVEADGRDLIVTGEAPDERRREEARRTVASTWGHRVVLDRMTVVGASRSKSDASGGADRRNAAADAHGSGAGQPEGPVPGAGTPAGPVAGADTPADPVAGAGTPADPVPDANKPGSAGVPGSKTPTALGASAAQSACQDAVDELLTRRQIKFEFGSSRLSDESVPLLNRISRALRPCPEAQFEIEGHTDAQGSTVVNQRLSTRRARAVLYALAARGIDKRRMTAIGYGSSRPIANNDDPAGRARNRRIEVRVLRKE